MSRVPHTVALLACGALALPGVARADGLGDGMCAVVHPAAFEVGRSHSVDPAELETADPAAVPGDEAPAGVLLCTHANDPRCSPLSTEDTPSSPDMPARAAAMLHQPTSLPAVPLRVREVGGVALLGPSLGPTSRLERPPRG